MQGREFDFEKFRLRTFVDRLIDLDEVEVRAEPTPLTALSEIIENTQKAVLFKQAGPERVEIIAKAAGSRKRLIAAFDSTPEKVYEEFLNRSAARMWAVGASPCVIAIKPARTSPRPPI